MFVGLCTNVQIAALLRLKQYRGLLNNNLNGKKMTDIMSAIASDIEEYEWLCERYDEEIQLEQNLYGKWVPDCYCDHATKLKKIHMDDIEVKRLAAGASEKN